MLMHRLRLLGALGVATAFACSRSPDGKGPVKPQTDAAKKDSSVSPTAEMPGMAMPSSGATTDAKKSAVATSLDLSPAQIAHGKVEWATVTIGTATGAATIPGQITADEDHTARLGAPARGRVLSVMVSPGDRVGQGQALATLQSSEASMSQSDIAKATAAMSSRRAQAQYAKAARDRAERLLALKAIPRQDYEKAVAEDELAQSEFRQSEAELRRARSVAEQLGADSTPNGNITLRSPLSGVVLARAAIPGTVVDAGAPLLVVTDPTRLWLTVNAPEQFAGMLRVGGQLRFMVPAYADTFTARITALGAGLETETRTLPVRAATDSRGNRLKPGMLATVVIVGGQRSSVAIVPEDAIQAIEGKPTVFIVRADGKGGAHVTRREVEVGSRTSGRVAVLRGLSVGDVIVTTGAFAVKAAFLKGNMPKMEM
jgi:cobalt-zinc-cadmium efflux system membrane fusion protein